MFKRKHHPTIEELKIEQELQLAVLNATFKNLENFRWNQTMRREADMIAKAGLEEGGINLYPAINQPHAVEGAGDAVLPQGGDNEREHQLRMKEMDHKHEEEMMRLSANVGGILVRKKEPIIMEKPRCFSGIMSLFRRKVRKDHKNQKDNKNK